MDSLLQFAKDNIVAILIILVVVCVKSMYDAYSLIRITNKKIDSLSGRQVDMLVRPLDADTHNIIMENLKGMIILYTIVTIKNDIVAKQNQSMNYIVSIDSIEAKELKEVIIKAIYDDLPDHLISYLEYYFGNTFLQVYIEAEIVQAILEESSRMPKA